MQKIAAKTVSPLILCSCTLLAAILLCGAVSADFLVLRDGQVIETKGPWTDEGRRITYTAMNGTFSALRATLVDLEKSKERSAAKPPKKASPTNAPAKKPGLVVRQSDVRTLSPSSQTSETTGTTVEPGTIKVAAWDEVLVTNGTRITGTLRNATDSVYLSLKLNVTLVADNGDALATQAADLQKNWVDAGADLPFEVSFADVFAFTNATFEIEGMPFQRPDAGDDEEGDEASSAGGGPPGN